MALVVKCMHIYPFAQMDWGVDEYRRVNEKQQKMRIKHPLPHATRLLANCNEKTE